LYDAAHAFGVVHRGKAIGCFGDLSVFSFHATKLFHSGEGGAVAGADAQHLPAVTSLRNFGIRNEEVVRGVGVNGKMSELQAALGLSVLDTVDDEIARRAVIAARLRARLEGVEGVLFQATAPDTVPNHAYFTIEIDADAFGLSRDQLHTALRAENIITRKYFYPLCSDNEAYAHLPSARAENLPNARRLAGRILCLPMYGDLAAADADRIADAVLAVRAAAPRVRAALEAT
jgi:dTDP-4-amino-4,6-dideoxygalactose transaminase